MFKPNFLIINVYHISRKLNYRFNSLQSEPNVRVRFAPSPTGELHLGSLRTALFNYLYARKYDGKFILRLEDTDRDRLVQGVDKKIEQTLEYFGLKLDESPEIGGEFGPYIQSERLSLYKNAANKLIESGHAYKCFCTPERLNILRVKCLNEKIKPKYDLFCRNLSTSEIESRENEGKKSVIRFKFEPGEKKFKDTVFGNDYKCYLDEVDFVIMKADGFPTYHFANVVDDHHMQITDVIRGSEWLMSTPKHVEIYSAFNWKSPKFTHLPLLTQDGHKKLSKRNKAAFVDYYTRLGYLPDAVLNFLLRNGSGITNHNKNKLYTLQELVDNFDENLIGKNSFMMDMKELDRYGRMAFKEASFNDLLPIIKYQFSLLDEEIKHSINEELLQEDYFKKVVSFLQSNEEAFTKISDITNGGFRFFFMMPKSAKKLMESFPNVSQTIDLMKEFIIYLRADKFTYNDLKILAKEKQILAPNLSKLIRLSLLDNVSGPPISELVEFFGKEGIEQRLNWMINRINDDAIEETKRSVA